MFPEEEALVRAASERRRGEFRMARLCAHRAMRLLGLEPRPVLRGDRGMPVWPPGVVGSITHCAGYRAAALALGAHPLGIDAEPHQPVPDGVLGRIATPSERGQLDGLGVEHPGRVLFSAKESVYKAWYPLTGRWLGFLEAELTLCPSGTFSASVRRPLNRADPPGFTGRWSVTHGLVLSAATATTT